MPFNLYFEYRVVSFFFRLVKSQRPVYLFSSLRCLGSRTGNFDFPERYHVGSILARGVCFYNRLPRAIKDSCSVAAFGRGVFALYNQNVSYIFIFEIMLALFSHFFSFFPYLFLFLFLFFPLLSSSFLFFPLFYFQLN
jgi:hypothetical protein